MKITVVEGPGISLSLIARPPDLAPYITVHYRTVAGPGDAIEDFLPPEWANLRAGSAAVYEAASGGEAPRQVPAAVISGPTRKVTRLRIRDRFCARRFGFTPQSLPRRQRFLRSLGKIMVDPSMKWIASLDTHYHGQAHFRRNFQRFLGMSPGEYAAMQRPVAMTAPRARRDALGEAMQVLQVSPQAEAA